MPLLETSYLNTASQQTKDAGTFVSKLLCLVCLNEQTVPPVGAAAGVPNDEGTMLQCSQGCNPEIHTPIQMPTHCGKRMKYFEDEDADQFRVCPD